jgi:hypothetical protein
MQTRTIYFTVPDKRGGYIGHFYKSDIILLYFLNQQGHFSVYATQGQESCFYQTVRGGRPESTLHWDEL